MLHRLKAAFYFPVAHYFAFFARIRLARWKPRIVVVTGSNGKTTSLHMIEARLGTLARYTHHHNSSFGISFDILDLKDTAGSRWKWFTLGALAPVRALRTPPKEKIYIVEADCDRPGEGKFLAELLKPEAVVWLNAARTHSAQFEHSVALGAFESVDDAIAHEYGFFLAETSKLCIINTDDERIVAQAKRSRAKILGISDRDLQSYSVSVTGTEFALYGARYKLPFLLPKETFYAIAASANLAQYFGIQPTNDLAHFSPPPGRSSLFHGIKDTTIVDSSYNINVSSLGAILAMTRELKGTKWLVFGDMTEQGVYEAEEHEKAAALIADADFARVFLVGPRARRFVLPVLQAHGMSVESHTHTSEVVKMLPAEIEGGEIIVFKGARFLEAIVEEILADKKDAEKLCRREDFWKARRKQWQL